MIYRNLEGERKDVSIEEKILTAFYREIEFLELLINL